MVLQHGRTLVKATSFSRVDIVVMDKVGLNFTNIELIVQSLFTYALVEVAPGEFAVLSVLLVHMDETIYPEPTK